MELFKTDSVHFRMLIASVSLVHIQLQRSVSPTWQVVAVPQMNYMMLLLLGQGTWNSFIQTTCIIYAKAGSMICGQLVM
jgi:hypothetical protein